MKPSKEVWVVSEYGGEYEDKWEHVIGVFSTESLAKEFVEWFKENKKKNVIPLEKFNKLIDEMCDYQSKIGDEFYEQPESYWINKLHPEYSIVSIEMTEFYYDNFYSDADYMIEKINYYGE